MDLRKLTRSNAVWAIPWIVYAACLSGYLYVFSDLGPADCGRFALSETSPFAAWLNALCVPKWSCLTVLLLFASLYLLLLQALVRRYELLRSLSLFPSAFYLMFMASAVPFYAYPSDHLVSLLLLVWCLFLFNAYRNDQPNTTLFNAFFVLGLASLLRPSLILALPLLLAIVHLVIPLSVKRLSVCLSGILTVLWITASVAFLLDRMEVVDAWLGQVYPAFSLPEKAPLPEIAYWAGGAALFLCGTQYFLVHIGRERNSVRSHIGFLLILWLIFNLMALLFSGEHYVYMILSMTPMCLLAGYYFTEVDHWGSRLLLVAVLVAQGWFYLACL